MDDLDAELEGYWNDKNDRRKDQAIQAGKKRSVHDRLGSRVNSQESPTNDFETMSIPPPGMPREIPELSQTVLESLSEVMDQQSSTGHEDSSLSSAENDNKATILGDELASKLSEPKTELMIGVVELVGVDVCLELFNRTRDIESQGGMMIKVRITLT